MWSVEYQIFYVIHMSNHYFHMRARDDNKHLIGVTLFFSSTEWQRLFLWTFQSMCTVHCGPLMWPKKSDAKVKMKSISNVWNHYSDRVSFWSFAVAASAVAAVIVVAFNQSCFTFDCWLDYILVGGLKATMHTKHMK